MASTVQQTRRQAATSRRFTRHHSRVGGAGRAAVAGAVLGLVLGLSVAQAQPVPPDSMVAWYGDTLSYTVWRPPVPDTVYLCLQGDEFLPCDLTVPPDTLPGNIELGYALEGDGGIGADVMMPLDGAEIQADSIWVRLLDPDQLISPPVMFYVDGQEANSENSWRWDMWSVLEWSAGVHNVRATWGDSERSATFTVVLPAPPQTVWLGYSLTEPDYNNAAPMQPLDGATLPPGRLYIRLVDSEQTVTAPVRFYRDGQQQNQENFWPWDMRSGLDFSDGSYTVRADGPDGTTDATFTVESTGTPPPGDRVDEWPTAWALGKQAIRRDYESIRGTGVCVGIDPEHEEWRCRYEADIWCPHLGDYYASIKACQDMSAMDGATYPDTVGQPAWAMGPFN